MNTFTYCIPYTLDDGSIVFYTVDSASENEARLAFESDIGPMNVETTVIIVATHNFYQVVYRTPKPRKEAI